MATCSAYGCTNKPKKHTHGISFHNFPTDEPQRSKWIRAVRRKNWHPSICSHSKLCSIHFREEMIDRTKRNVVLHPNAVPTIFPAFIPDLQTKRIHKMKKAKQMTSVVEVKKEIPDMHHFSAVTSTSSSLNEDTFNQSSLDKRRELQISNKTNNESILDSKQELDRKFPDNNNHNNSEDSPSSESNFDPMSQETLKQELEIMTRLYKRTCKKLKVCQEQCKIYVKQIITLEEVIDNLKQINSVTDCI